MVQARNNSALGRRADRAASRWLALPLLRIYRWAISPALYMLGSRCRFYPSCGHYAEEAFRAHGFFRGLWLSAVRVAKCSPLHPGGHDPVPAPKQGGTSAPAGSTALNIVVSRQDTTEDRAASTKQGA